MSVAKNGRPSAHRYPLVRVLVHAAQAPDFDGPPDLAADFFNEF